MAEPHVISALIRKRAELSGEMVILERSTRQTRASLDHVDACLAMFGYRGDPSGIPAVQVQNGRLFKRGHLKRAVLEIRREAGGTISNQGIAEEIIRRMGWDADDHELRVKLTRRVKDVTKRVPL